MKNTADPVIINRKDFDQAGRYGSFSLVTGLVLNVFTLVSNSAKHKKKTVTSHIISWDSNVGLLTVP